MLGTRPTPLGPRPIEPRPLHNGDASIRALARQMLADLDDSAITTPVQTASLRMLLERLCDALADPSKAAEVVTSGAMTDEMRNPNLAYWQHRAEEDADRAAVDEP